jgi:hypothetical protein
LALPASADSFSPYVAFRLGHAQTKWDGGLTHRTDGWTTITPPVQSGKFSAKDGNIFGALAAGVSFASLPIRTELEYAHLGSVSDKEYRQIQVNVSGTD